MDRRIRIRTDNTPPSNGYRSKGIVAGGYLFTAGWIGVPMGSDHATVAPADTFAEQTNLILSYLDAVTQAAGLTKADVLEVSAFVAEPDSEDEVRSLVDSYLGFTPPMFNYHRVQGVARDAMLELDWIAQADASRDRQEATEILRPMGHGEGLVHSGPFVMINGLTAPGETLGDQTYAVMAEADRQLRDAGSALDELCKLNVFYVTPTYPGDYPQFNEATKDLFRDFEPPTRSVVRSPDKTGERKLCIDFLALAKD